ncbi:unnamed protein product [Alopecurus aequalis]
MEEENSQPPVGHQLEPAEELEAIFTPGAAAAAAADAPVYDVYMDEEEEVEADQQAIDFAIAAPTDDVYMEEDDVAAKEEEGRQNRAAAIAADEEMAHRLYMEELQEMDEWQLRDMDRPSLRAALDLPLGEFPTSSSSSSRAGVGFNTKGKDPVVQPYVPGPLQTQAVRRIEEIIATASSASNGGSSSSTREEGADDVVLPRSLTMADIRGLGTNTTSGSMRPGPRDFATTPARQTVQSRDAVGSSSTQQVPGDGKTSAVASEDPAPANVVPSAGCGGIFRPARPTVPANSGPVSTKRRALLAEADSAIMFAGMEEGHNNTWYESIVPDDDEKPEQVEVQSLNESLQQCLPRFEPCNPAANVTEGHEFSLQDFCQRWGVTPSDVHPDEPGPSTRAPKVPPLADHEVPTFSCGICMDTLPVFDLFHGLPCRHKFCASCMTTYVEGRIRSTELPIPCPDPACGMGVEDGGRGMLHPEKCKKAIDYGAFVDWGTRLAENALPPGRRAYCPNRGCRVPLETAGEGEPVMAACPACGEALCAICGMQWSSDGTGLGGHDCAKGPDAALLRTLARERRWKECPSCKTFVERIDGCDRMTCRCRFVFCYRCGRPSFRGQVGGEGLEPCRCNDAGLAFAFGHLHQAHPNIVDLNMQLPPMEVDLNQQLPLNQMNQPIWDVEPAEPDEELD